MVDRKPTKAGRKNVVWRHGLAYARATIKGKEYTKPLQTRSPRQAEELAREWLVDLKRNRGRDKPVPTVVDMFNHFNEHHLPRVSKKTQTRYLHSILTLSDFFEEESVGTVAEIGSAVLQKYETFRRNDRISNATIRRDLYTLSIVFSVFVEGQLWEENPVLPWLKNAKRRGLAEPEPRHRFFTIEEEATIRRSALIMGKRTPHVCKMLNWFVPVTVDVGGRQGEMLGLRWPSVNFERSEVILTGKRGKRRVVPLLPRARKILLAMPRHTHTDLVFYSERGGKIHELWHALQDAAEHAGIEDVCVHDLRRTCGVRLLRGIGIPRPLTMAQVSLWLGHSSVKVTERVYAFLSVDDLHGAIASSLSPDLVEATEKSRYITSGKTIEDAEIVIDSPSRR